MSSHRLLVANRGEIAIRVIRAAADLDWHSVAVYSEDDARCLHTVKADEAVPLTGQGARTYLDIEQLVEAARRSGCDLVHPGYGFLSESSEFARACGAAGLGFVGPSPDVLDRFGDKAAARALAAECDVPVLPGSDGPVTLDEAREFFRSLGAGAEIMLKAVSGGGGRGMRAVADASELDSAYERCRSEALLAFGSDAVYVEERLSPARHVEVQVVGDGERVTHAWERECTLQRRNQKLVEVAPAPRLSASLRAELLAAALRMADRVRLQGLATVEFLVEAERGERFAFLEVNPRLQVEHTVTEAVTGLDLVRAQLEIATGATLDSVGLGQPLPEPRGHAVQLRINMETMSEDGSARPSGGTLTAFELPCGAGTRCDTLGYVGYATSPRFDSLLAKLVTHSSSSDFGAAIRRAYRALCEVKIEGVPTNLAFLQSLLRREEVEAGRVDTGFVERHAGELLADATHDRHYFAAQAPSVDAGIAGARIDSSNPLAVLDHGKSGAASPSPPPQTPGLHQPEVPGPPGTQPVCAPLQGTIVSLDVSVGETVRPGQALLVMEAMKMEHLIEAPVGGTVRQIVVAAGDAVFEGHVLLHLEEADLGELEEVAAAPVDLDRIRPDLAEAVQRHEVGLDDARPAAVEKRRKTGQRTTRENVDDLCDAGSFVEYGSLVLAAQRRRRSVQELIEKTPADGLVAGVGTVNADLFGAVGARCVVMSYDYTVLAGTQGAQNHRKKDRMFELAEQRRLPLVFFTEGGGGRPGDTDGLGVAGLDCLAFHYFGRLSGRVPLVGINSGYCFAGNAALLGCCDVVIATANSNIGMGGPAMIEGGGLGIFRPDEIGPMDVQVPNGVVDVAVEDEAEAVEVAKKYLSYFQGSLGEWSCADQRLLRSAIPENRLRIYEVRGVLDTLADTDSVLELRRGFGPGMLTALVRIEGRPLGVIANDPTHLAGAIDSDAADKASRFMQLCDAFDIPLLFLCDTPGIMVGPEAEKQALVRHAARMFVTAGSLSVPYFTIVLRKGYGLGAQAMAGGSFKAPFFTVAWPTGEFGGMGLEGAVKLGFRNELAAIEDPHERLAKYQEMVDRMYEHGKAVNAASHFEIDDVIDPAQSRRWISRALESLPPEPGAAGRRRPCVDTW